MTLWKASSDDVWKWGLSSPHLWGPSCWSALCPVCGRLVFLWKKRKCLFFFSFFFFLWLSHFAVKCPDWMFQTGKKMYLYAVQTIGGLIHDLHFRNKVALWMHYCQMCIFLLKTSKWTLSLSKDTDESKWYDAISVIFIIVSAFCSIHLMLTINPFLSGFWNVEWSPST